MPKTRSGYALTCRQEQGATLHSEVRGSSQKRVSLRLI